MARPYALLTFTHNTQVVLSIGILSCAIITLKALTVVPVLENGRMSLPPWASTGSLSAEGDVLPAGDDRAFA